jgi:nitrate/nitrite transport system substrate-binding protein
VPFHAAPAEPVEQPRLTLGFMPLTDCAPLVIAREKGFFSQQGLDVALSREPSWSAVRDKLAVNVLQGAHLLAGIPLASTLGVSGVKTPMITALSLSLNGNAITVSTELHEQMRRLHPLAMSSRPVSAAALRRVIDERACAGRSPLTFAVVFPVSSHHYQLRYWLAASGVDADRDIRLIIVPPQRMVDALRTGLIDGYCAGGPWNALAADEGVGHVVITGYEIWNNAPEKVFGVTAEWAANHPATHRALLRALLQAAMWIEQPEHRAEAAEILSRPEYVGAPVEVMRRSLSGDVYSAYSFFRYAATFPWRSHAMWTLAQMKRWGQIPSGTDIESVARAVYRPDIYREVADTMRLPHPRCDIKAEGHHTTEWHMPTDRSPLVMGPDRFFDGQIFNPRQIAMAV